MAEWEGSSILVIRLSSLGDIARLLPSLRALKTSSAERVDLTVEDRFEPLMRLFPIPDHVVAYPRRKAGNPLRRPVPWVSAYAQYLHRCVLRGTTLRWTCTAFSDPPSLDSLAAPRIRPGFGPRYGKENSHLLYEKAVFPGPTPVLSRYDRYAGTLAALGFPGTRRRLPGARSPTGGPAGRGGLPGWLRPAIPAPICSLSSATSTAQAEKRWPAFRFVETAHLVWDELGLETVIGWGPEESDLVRRLGRQPHVRFIPDWGTRPAPRGDTEGEGLRGSGYRRHAPRGAHGRSHPGAARPHGSPDQPAFREQVEDSAQAGDRQALQGCRLSA